jgi:hypothetical protein
VRFGLRVTSLAHGTRYPHLLQLRRHKQGWTMTNRRMLAAAILGLTTAATAWADVLLIERTEQAQRASVPTNGLTMAQVEARFGAPSERMPPVAGYKPAHPAITRWRYPAFMVYFENQRVISTVLAPTSAVASR